MVKAGGDLRRGMVKAGGDFRRGIVQPVVTSGGAWSKQVVKVAPIMPLPSVALAQPWFSQWTAPPYAPPYAPAFVQGCSGGEQGVNRG